MNRSALLSARGMDFSGATQSLTLLRQAQTSGLWKAGNLSDIDLSNGMEQEGDFQLFLQRCWAEIVQVCELQGRTCSEMQSRPGLYLAAQVRARRPRKIPSWNHRQGWEPSREIHPKIPLASKVSQRKNPFAGFLIKPSKSLLLPIIFLPYIGQFNPVILWTPWILNNSGPLHNLIKRQEKRSCSWFERTELGLERNSDENTRVFAAFLRHLLSACLITALFFSQNTAPLPNICVTPINPLCVHQQKKKTGAKLGCRFLLTSMEKEKYQKW